MIWWYLTSKWMYPAHPFSVQFSSVAQSCPTLCNPMNHSTPGLPVHHQLPKFTQTHATESVMPSSHLILCRPLLLLPPSLPASGSFPMSQISHEVAKVLEFQLQLSPSNEHPGLIFRMDWLDLLAVQGTFVFSNTTVQKQQFFSAQLSSQPNSHMTTGKTIDWPDRPLLEK